jgi:hypothetical protein
MNYRGMDLKSKESSTGKAVCDLTGDIVPYTDLVKQYRYTGNGKVWTGLWVYKNNVDKLNAQLLSYEPKIDPVPLDHPRPIIIVPYNPDENN